MKVIEGIKFDQIRLLSANWFNIGSCMSAIISDIEGIKHIVEYDCICNTYHLEE